MLGRVSDFQWGPLRLVGSWLRRSSWEFTECGGLNMFGPGSGTSSGTRRCGLVGGSMSLGGRGGCDSGFARIPALLPLPLCGHKCDQAASCSCFLLHAFTVRLYLSGTPTKTKSSFRCFWTWCLIMGTRPNSTIKKIVKRKWNR